MNKHYVPLLLCGCILLIGLTMLLTAPVLLRPVLPMFPPHGCPVAPAPQPLAVGQRWLLVRADPDPWEGRDYDVTPDLVIDIKAGWVRFVTVPDGPPVSRRVQDFVAIRRLCGD